MKNKIFASFIAAILLLNLTGLSLADTGRKKKVKARQTNPLVALLPASDAVVTFDVKRFFSDALPKLLSANQPLLAKINAALDEMQQKAGIDLRQFDQVAAGLAFKQQPGKNPDFDPVIIARGDINSGALLGVAKLASNGKYREEKIGTHTLYIFSVKEATKAGSSKAAGAVDRTLNGWNEVALTSIDPNTVAFGSPGRVRQTLAATTHVGISVTTLLSRNPEAVMSFAAKIPVGMSKSLPHDNDELSKTIDSIRFVSGSMDLVEGAAALQLMARTIQPDQAQSLLETLQGLQSVGKALIGGTKGPQREVFARMIDSVRLARTGNEVTFDLRVPQSDIDILIGMIK
jgi:hypothetical protein